MTETRRFFRQTLWSLLCLIAAMIAWAPATLAHGDHSGHQNHHHLPPDPPPVIPNEVTVILGTSSPYIPQGTSFNVEVGIDFTDLLMGGSLHLDYDSDALELVSFSFDSVVGQPIVTDFTESTTGAYLTWGWFEGFDRLSISGIHRIGTLTFIASNKGPASLVSTAVGLAKAGGPLVGPGPASNPLDGAPVDVHYGKTYFSIIPEPGTASMILLGLMILKLQARRGRMALRGASPHHS